MSDASQDVPGEKCEMCNTELDEHQVATSREFCDPCEEKFGADFNERLRKENARNGFAFHLFERNSLGFPVVPVEDPEVEAPVVIDLAAEGLAIANILGNLSELCGPSKQRVLNAVNSLMMPAFEAPIKTEDLVRRPRNGTSDDEVVANFRRLEMLLGAGDEDEACP